MTGLLVKKYHVAVLDSDQNFLTKVVSSLNSWYQDRIVIKTYKDSHSLLEAVNSNKAKKCPFDLAVLSPNEYVEKLILQRFNPHMKIMVCKDGTILQSETAKLLL